MSRWTKAALGVLVAGILALGGVGGYALAQSGTEKEASQPQREQFLNGVADTLGVPVDQLKGAIQSTELEMLDNAVAQGKVRPEVADRLRQRIEAGEPAAVSGWVASRAGAAERRSATGAQRRCRRSPNDSPRPGQRDAHHR